MSLENDQHCFRRNPTGQINFLSVDELTKSGGKVNGTQGTPASMYCDFLGGRYAIEHYQLERGTLVAGKGYRRYEL